MAHATTSPEHEYSPERAVQEIRTQRKRNALLALAAAIVVLIGFGSVVYLAYNDVPAPESPANAPVRR